MMNDLCEDLMPIRATVDELPRRPDGRTVHPSTVARWALYGISGIKLRSTKLAGRRYVRRADLQRFLEQCAGR
jgi:hypothetical protein